MSSNFSYRRAVVKAREGVNQRLKMNPFVFSRAFFVWVLLGLVGGVVTGVYWDVLILMMDYLKQFSQGWQVIAIMGTAGLIVGIIIHYAGDPGKLEIVLNNIRFKGGRLDTHHNPSMIVTSLIGISAGSSCGPEAPMVQVNGSIGSWLSHKFKMHGEEARSMTIAGMAVGFTGMFGVPLAGCLFAMEVIHHKHVMHYYAALIPAFVASCTSYIIFQLISQNSLEPVWKLPFSFTAPQMMDFVWAIFFGALSAAIGWLTISSFQGLKKLFKTIKLPIYVQTLLSGIILGYMAWKLPVTRYFSKHEVVELLKESWEFWTLIAIILVKIFAMTLSVTSGWRGGYIIPLLFIGAAVGLAFNQIFPNDNPGLAVVCCMAAVNSCVTRTPVSTVILVGTLTGFQFFIPILFASLTGFFLAPKSPLIAAQMGKEMD